MDNPIEQNEQPSNKELKKINQRFHPFDDSEVNLEHEQPDVFTTHILLDIKVPGVPNLPIFLQTGRVDFPIRIAITPFNLNAGYQITEEDLRIEPRLAKLRQAQFAENIKQNPELAPLWFKNGMSDLALVNLGVAEEGYPRQIKAECLSIIERLRMQVFIPGSPSEITPDDPEFHSSVSLEARPAPGFIRIAVVTFDQFYPLETGPLPGSLFPEPHIMEGFRICLPNDIKKLSQVEVKFILLPEGEKSDGESEQAKRPTHDIYGVK